MAALTYMIVCYCCFIIITLIIVFNIIISIITSVISISSIILSIYHQYNIIISENIIKVISIFSTTCII